MRFGTELTMANCSGHSQMLCDWNTSFQTQCSTSPEWATNGARDSRPSLTALGSLVSKAGLHQARGQLKEDSPLKVIIQEAGQGSAKLDNQTRRARAFKEKRRHLPKRKKNQGSFERGMGLKDRLPWMETAWRPLSAQLKQGESERVRKAQAAFGERRLSKENALEN